MFGPAAGATKQVVGMDIWFGVILLALEWNRANHGRTRRHANVRSNSSSCKSQPHEEGNVELGDQGVGGGKDRRHGQAVLFGSVGARVELIELFRGSER